MRLSKVIVKERIGEALIEIEGTMKKLTMHMYRRCCYDMEREERVVPHPLATMMMTVEGNLMGLI